METVVLDLPNHVEPRTGEQGTRICVGEPSQMSPVMDSPVAKGPTSAHRQLEERVVETDVRQADHDGCVRDKQFTNCVQHSRRVNQVLENIGADHAVEPLGL